MKTNSTNLESLSYPLYLYTNAKSYPKCTVAFSAVVLIASCALTVGILAILAQTHHGFGFMNHISWQAGTGFTAGGGAFLLAMIIGSVICYLRRQNSKEQKNEEKSETTEPLQKSQSPNLNPKPSFSPPSPASIKYSEITTKETAGDYDLLQIHSTWVIFNKRESQSKENNKFHVSIARDNENLEKAFNVIFPILEKYQICRFKILPLENIKIQGNSLGKEITIYIQESDNQEKDPNFWGQKVLKEIVDALEVSGVKPGIPSNADKIVEGGKGFIYVRSPNNIFGRYVEADYLKQWGFSLEESPRLSPSPWIDLTIGDAKTSQKPEKKALRLPTFNWPNQLDKEDTIFSQFVNDLMKKEKWETSPLFFLMIGTEEFRTSIFTNQIMIRCMPILFDVKREYNCKCIGGFYKEIQLSTSLKSLLAKAARLTAALRLILDVPAAKVCGNIIPAIYHSLMVPIATKNDPILNPNEERQLIKQIALCALRERAEFPEPVAISDSDLDKLMAIISAF